LWEKKTSQTLGFLILTTGDVGTLKRKGGKRMNPTSIDLLGGNGKHGGGHHLKGLIFSRMLVAIRKKEK